MFPNRGRPTIIIIEQIMKWIKGILSDFKQRELSKISEFEFFTSVYSSSLKKHFSKGIKQKSFHGEIRAIFP